MYIQLIKKKHTHTCTHTLYESILVNCIIIVVEVEHTFPIVLRKMRLVFIRLIKLFLLIRNYRCKVQLGYSTVKFDTHIAGSKDQWFCDMCDNACQTYTQHKKSNKP